MEEKKLEKRGEVIFLPHEGSSEKVHVVKISNADDARKMLDCELLEFCETHGGNILAIDEEGKKKRENHINLLATSLYKYGFSKKGKMIDCIAGNALWIPKDKVEEIFG